jgi:hypothetical protein
VEYSKQALTGFVAISVSMAALTACGGGGSSSTSAGTAEGVYKGTVSNSSTASAFNAVVLEDGQIWALYGNSIGGTLFVSGLIQGQGTTNNGSFSSSSVKDFGTNPSVAGTLNASYVAGASLAGTFSSASGNVSLAGTAVPAADFNYNTPALLSDVLGNWTLISTSTNVISMNIAANGTYTGTDTGGCTLSGTITPRSSGKNIFNTTMSIGPAPCALPGWTGGGIGIYSTLTNGTHQLILAAVDSSRAYGSASFGTR